MLNRRVLPLFASLGLFALAGCNAPQGLPAPEPASRQATTVVRFSYAGPAELGKAVDAGLDLHGVDAEQRVAFGAIEREKLTALDKAGIRYTVQPVQMNAANEFDKGFHTYEQLTSELKQLADRYPQRLTLKSIGASWETTQHKADRQIWMTRITGPGDASKRPAVVFTANLHARELVPVEMALHLIRTLSENYDSDPAIKKLVDTRVVYIVPMANPDGHHQAEAGENWRKNTHAFPKGVGVDLNRNFPFKWGGAGTSDDPKTDIYRGPSAASEPETQAIRDFLSGVPNLRIGMDYHAYSNLVMWSWGWTGSPPPDAPLLSTIGKKLASFNGYKPIQASELYPTSGSIRDFVYGELHVPYFTTEIGSQADGFDPSYARCQKLIAENMPGALYLLSIADNPSQVLSAGTRR